MKRGMPRTLVASCCVLIVALCAASANAGSMLVDFNKTSNFQPTTYLDFSVANGVSAADVAILAAEQPAVWNDLEWELWTENYYFSWDPGGMIWPWASGNPLYGAAPELWLLDSARGYEGARGINKYGGGNNLMEDYLYLQSGHSEWYTRDLDGPDGTLYADGPVDVALTGLADYLEPNYNYKFYLFGAVVGAAGQESTFTFQGDTQTTAMGAPAVFDYQTAADHVEDYVIVNWSRQNRTFAGWNGYAFVQGDLIPEPSTFIMLVIGLLGLLGYAWCRRKK